MTGHSSLTTKNSGSTGHHTAFAPNPDSKSDNKDVKRGSGERKESNKGNSTGQATAARRSMSDDMHEDVYMAKSDQAKARKRPFKASSVIEQTNPNMSASHNTSVNSTSAYERSHYKQMKKNAASNSTKQIGGGNRQWGGVPDYKLNQSGHHGHYSETNSSH